MAYLVEGDCHAGKVTSEAEQNEHPRGHDKFEADCSEKEEQQNCHAARSTCMCRKQDVHSCMKIL